MTQSKALEEVELNTMELAHQVRANLESKEHFSDEVALIADALEAAEKRGRIAELRGLESVFCGDECARTVIDWAEQEADRLESELNTEPGEGSK